MAIRYSTSHHILKKNPNRLAVRIFCFIFAPMSGKDPLRQKKRYAPNLRDENVGNFQQARAEISRRAERLPRMAWGCVSIFLFQVFLRPSSRNWQRQSRASAVW